MNSSQLSLIKEAKRILNDCACFQGPEGPQGSSIIGPPGPVGPPGTISTFSVNGSTNCIVYYDGTTLSGMSSLFYYSTTNTLQANLDIIPCTDIAYNLGSGSYRWKDLYVGPSSIHLGTQAHIYEDATGQVATNIGFRGSNMTTSTLTLGNGFGWQLQSVDGANYDLLATRYSGNVFTGPTLSLLYPAGYISTAALTSTVRGLGTAGYISSSQLFSTIGGLGTSVLPSTVRGLGTAGYISSSQLISTTTGLGNIYISSLDNFLPSTTNSLGSAGYISSSQLTSTVRGLGTAGYISSSQLFSTVDGLGRIYPSTINFTSTVRGLGTAGYISSSQLTSTVSGLGNAGYISSSQLLSTVTGIPALMEPYKNSTITGLGNIGYISSSQLQSTVSGIPALMEPYKNSTITGLGNIGYISSTQLLSTVRGLGNAGYISSSQLISTAIGIDNDVHQDIMEVTTSTIVGLGTYGYISSSQLISTVTGIPALIEPYKNSTITGLGNIGYISSSQLQSTVRGLGNTGYISSSQLTSTVAGLGQTYLSSFNTSFPSTVTGLGTAGYISTQQLQSTVKGLGQIYLSSIPTVLPNASFGKVLRVDSVYGNDTTALTNQYGFPFTTIAAAMGVASTSDMIYLLPGTYNETVVFRSTISIRGANTNSVTIQKANVTADTTLVKMNYNTRLEDVTLNLTSQSVLATKLIGVEISSCQTYAKLRTTVINVNNSGLTANGTPTNLYGVYSSGHSSTLQYSGADDVERTTINVIGAGTGNKRCVYNDDSNRIQLRNCSLYCTDAMNATYTGGSYIGIETANVNSIVAIKTSSVNGNQYNNNGTTSADISQTFGTIILSGTDLIHRTANNNGITVNGAQSIMSFAVSGILSNFLVFDAGGGHHISNSWSNSFLTPGTLSFTTVNADPITVYNGIRLGNTNLITTMGFQASTGPGVGFSTFAVLYKNGAIVPNYVLPITGTNTLNFLSTSTLTLLNTDTFGIYLSTSRVAGANSNNTSMSNPVISLSFY